MRGIDRRPWVALLPAALVCAAGCVQLRQPSPHVHSYRLAYDPKAPEGTRLPVILRIPALAVAASYDREAIVYGDDAYSTGSYFYDRWSVNPGNLVADLLARDFVASGRYRAVQQMAGAATADYQLDGTIESIEEYHGAGGCTARLQLRMTLVRTRSAASDAVLLQNTYGADEPCPCVDPAALAGAMSTALQRISLQVQEQVYDAISASLRN